MCGMSMVCVWYVYNVYACVDYVWYQCEVCMFVNMLCVRECCGMVCMGIVCELCVVHMYCEYGVCVTYSVCVVSVYV